MKVRPWTADDVAELRALKARNLTAREIAAALGITRNAVIGKLGRLGLHAKRAAPAQPRPDKEGTPSPRPSPPSGLAGGCPRRQGRRAARAGLPTDAPAGKGERPHAVDPHRPCQWIEGEPSVEDSCKCGAPAVEGRSYCPPHLARAYLSAAGQPKKLNARYFHFLDHTLLRAGRSA